MNGDIGVRNVKRFAYEMVAEVRGMPVEELAGVVGENYRRLFGG